jgi:protein-S-isoprenylcysteine O-methyltransferase Ste14
VDERPGADENRPTRRNPGLREALLVGEIVVVIVLLAGVVTYLLPGDARDVILRTPVLILVLIAGTAAVLWRISRPGRIDR